MKTLSAKDALQQTRESDACKARQDKEIAAIRTDIEKAVAQGKTWISYPLTYGGAENDAIMNWFSGRGYGVRLDGNTELNINWDCADLDG